uniref:RNA silencing suppressor n=1 Tax=Hop latent virus TaxID=104263 RepID=A0A3G1YZV1_9VIRU|nr:12 kDa protein [Hop latent virus]
MFYLRVALLLHTQFLEQCGRSDFHLCVMISLQVHRPVGVGRSSYARRRRAKLVGRCHRCYRLWPPTAFTTRCDNKTCFPGLTYNASIARFIRDGVPEVIPSAPN